ncbi:P-loop containing nucleoside triphosphate hydrolase protein [Amanita rubescens]|nr:P-loop containing nucleoside triphosphate hydrolase protein [Amanita rubescens]
MPAFLPLRVGKRKQDSTFEAGANPKKQASCDGGDADVHWMVQWRKPQYKKHKTWDGDGVLVIKGSRAELYDTDGKLISSGKAPSVLSQENVFFIGDKEVEFDRVLSADEYLSGACFAGSSNQASFPPANKANVQKPFNAPSCSTSNLVQAQPVSRDIAQPINPNAACCQWHAELYDIASPMFAVLFIYDYRHTLEGTSKTIPKKVYIQLRGGSAMIIAEDGTCVCMVDWDGNDFHSGKCFRTEKGEVVVTLPAEASELPRPNDEAGIALAQGRSTAVKQNPVATKQHKGFEPLHNPNTPGAVVMKSPNNSCQHSNRGSHLVPVVLDPILVNRMRPHQIEGVKFMYESVMGLRKHEGYGCILADEIFPQTIGLIWTMLKQNPYSGLGSSAKKVLLVCPVTLINNWKAEFYKWMGRDRINVVVCNKDVQVAQVFANVKAQQVLIIGYERLRTITQVTNPRVHIEEISDCHRLKSSSNKTRETFNAFRTQRRIILSGTPIQNDLREFHAMVDFCNPRLLDDYSAFRRTYEVPILRGRAPDASTREVEIGKLRSAQLHTIAESFVLRRDINEYVIFVIPTSLQLALYDSILQPEKIDDLVESSRTESLPMINILVKISNSPVLLKATLDNSRAKMSTGSDNDTFNQLLPLLPKETDIGDVSLSGKLLALSRLLRLLRQTTDEKCVIVSHYTSTLNILEVYCNRNGYSFLRLDGQTPAHKRQGYVNEFNKASQETCFLFLLSSKAGGVGLNLTGASRLCLIDSDWNPRPCSHDLQSMARCHRDGQKRPVFIYRFLTTGTIDEKIYQRQVTKLGLSGFKDITVSKNDSFTRNDLRDIFRVHPDTNCNTHDLLQCACDGLGSEAVVNERDSSEEKVQHPVMSFIAASQVKPEQLSLTFLHEWKHFDCSQTAVELTLGDEILSTLIALQNQSTPVQNEKCLSGGNISYVFGKSTVDSETLDST